MMAAGAAAFSSERWLAKRADDSDMQRLRAAFAECAKKAGYAQSELQAVADTQRAIALYQSVGFVEYGRNPRGFRSRLTGWQEVALMRLELDEEKQNDW